MAWFKANGGAVPTYEKAATTYTPSTSDQTIIQPDTLCNGAQVIKGVSLSAAAADIRSGSEVKVTSNGTTLASRTGTMAEKAAATITPTTADQTIVAANTFCAGAQVVKGVSLSAVAANIKAGTVVKIMSNGGTVASVTGTMPVYGGEYV